MQVRRPHAPHPLRPSRPPRLGPLRLRQVRLRLRGGGLRALWRCRQWPRYRCQSHSRRHRERAGARRPPPPSLLSRRPRLACGGGRVWLRSWRRRRSCACRALKVEHLSPHDLRPRFPAPPPPPPRPPPRPRPPLRPLPHPPPRHRSAPGAAGQAPWTSHGRAAARGCTSPPRGCDGTRRGGPASPPLTRGSSPDPPPLPIHPGWHCPPQACTTALVQAPVWAAGAAGPHRRPRSRAARSRSAPERPLEPAQPAQLPLGRRSRAEGHLRHLGRVSLPELVPSLWLPRARPCQEPPRAPRVGPAHPSSPAPRPPSEAWGTPDHPRPRRRLRQRPRGGERTHRLRPHLRRPQERLRAWGLQLSPASREGVLQVATAWTPWRGQGRLGRRAVAPRRVLGPSPADGR
mmetsp:Transcript_1716/g.5313  ORF Transcript_1716/g.5313 Transcript_1716/m.5313 type:complete len:403 (-) Transcript_1716:110-1318(-)